MSKDEWDKTPKGGAYKSHDIIQTCVEKNVLFRTFYVTLSFVYLVRQKAFET